MARDKKKGDELTQESVTLKQGTRISGAPYEPGDSVEVYAFEKRHLVANNYAEGSLEDTASPAEIEQGNLEKRTENEQVWHQGDDEGVVAGEEGSNVSGNANENT